MYTILVECYTDLSTAKTITATAAIRCHCRPHYRCNCHNPLILLGRSGCLMLPLSPSHHCTLLHSRHRSSSCHRSNSYLVHYYFRQLAAATNAAVIANAIIAAAATPHAAPRTTLLVNNVAPGTGCGASRDLLYPALLPGQCRTLATAPGLSSPSHPVPVDGHTFSTGPAVTSCTPPC